LKKYDPLAKKLAKKKKKTLDREQVFFFFFFFFFSIFDIKFWRIYFKNLAKLFKIRVEKKKIPKFSQYFWFKEWQKNSHKRTLERRSNSFLWRLKE
jgi:hypothetical protein